MKTILVTGGSGTIGSEFIRQNINHFNIVSIARNEKSQVALKRKFPEVEIVIGSIENTYVLETAYRKYNPDIVIHSAALKHVDTAEKQPSVAIQSNLIGSLRIIELSLKYGVGITIGISTDKACSPDNVYGQTKYLMERLFREYDSPEQRFVNCRFGNVAWSNGSVLPFWKRLYLQGNTLPVTDSNMTRLMFSKEEAAELINKSIQLCSSEKGYFILSKKMKKVNMLHMAELISQNTKIIGLRQGEKIDEELISEREIPFAKEIDSDYVLITDKEQSDSSSKLHKPISSITAIPMSDNEIIEIIGDKDSWSLDEHSTYY